MEFWIFSEYFIIILCMLFVCLKAYKTIGVGGKTSETVLSLDTSNLIKAICCIVIIFTSLCLACEYSLDRNIFWVTVWESGFNTIYAYVWFWSR